MVASAPAARQQRARIDQHATLRTSRAETSQTAAGSEDNTQDPYSCRQDGKQTRALDLAQDIGARVNGRRASPASLWTLRRAQLAGKTKPTPENHYTHWRRWLYMTGTPPNPDKYRTRYSSSCPEDGSFGVTLYENGILRLALWLSVMTRRRPWLKRGTLHRVSRIGIWQESKRPERVPSLEGRPAAGTQSIPLPQDQCHHQ